MKRFINCVLIFIFLLTAVCSVSAQNTGAVLANLSFNDYATNEQPADLEIKSKAYYISEYKKGEKGLKFLLSSKNSSITVPASTKDDFAVSFDILGEGGRFSGNVTLTGGTKTFIPINFTVENKITTHDKNNIGGFSFSTATNVTLIVHPALSTIDIYIDGRSKVYDYYVRSINISNLDSVTFNFNSKNENSAVILDNINVYEGSVLRSNLPVAQYNEELVELPDFNAEAVVGNTVFVNNNFETTSTMAVTAKTNKTGVIKEADGNGCYEMEKTGADDFFFDTSISGEEYVRIVAEYDIKLIDTASTFTLMTFKTSVGGWAPIMTVSGGSVKAGGRNITALSSSSWTTVSAAVNLDDETFDVYINGTLKASGVDFATSLNNNPIVLLRTHVPRGTNVAHFLIDNFKIYEGTEPKNIDNIESAKETIFPKSTNEEKLMQGNVGLHLRSGVLYADNNKTLLDPAPFIVDGRTLIPVRAVSEAFGLGVNWDEKTSTVTVDGTTEIIIDKSEMNVNGRTVALDVPATIKDGRTFIPFRALCEDVLGKKVYYDDTVPYNSGMIIISDKEFSAPKDANALQRLNDFLFYYRPTAKQVTEMYDKNGLKNAHPRLFINSEGLEKLKQEIETYPVKKAWADAVIKVADGYVENNIAPTYGTYDGTRMSSTPAAKNYALGMAYMLTKDKKYVDAAWVQMQAICSWSDWNPSHYLDTAEMSAGVAVGYDWMYDGWTQEQREFIEEGIHRNGLLESELWQYGLKGSATRWCMANNNWNLVCNGSITIAALGFMDVYPDLCSRLIQNTFRGTESMMFHFAPDGAWFEGPGYWSYTMQYVSRMIAAADTVLGTDFGLSKCEGLSTTAEFILHMQSNIGTYNFADASTSKVYPESLYFLANKYNNPSIAAATLYQTGSSSNSPLALIWLDPEIQPDKITLPLDSYFRDTEAVSMRESWTEKESTYLAYHGGYAVREHSHLDQGSFIFESGGERWAIDMGSDNYNLPGYWSTSGPRWNIFRMRAASHNTIVINPGAAPDDHDLDAFAQILSLESKPRGAISTVDMTSSLKANAKSAKRGFFLTDNRKSLVVRDEINLSDSGDVYWFMYTKAPKADITGNSVVLTSIAGQRLHVDFITNKNAEITFEDAIPLPGTPTVSGENPNSGIYRIKLKVSGSGTVNITAKLTPDAIKASDVSEYNINMDKWEIPDGEIPPSPTLDMIYINGEPVADFVAGTKNYSYSYVEGDTDVPEITAESSLYNIEINNNKNFNAPVTIKVIDKNDPENYSIYSVNYVMLPKPVELDGFTTYAVRNVTAVDEPQAENPKESALDGNLNTRWSAQGTKDIWLDIDLGSVQNVDTVLLATYQGSARSLIFKILVSEDGKNYTEVYDGRTSGKTDDLEAFNIGEQKAKHIRISCYGTTTGDWNSITELIAAHTK